MKEDLLENWLNLIEQEDLANKQLGLATLPLLEKRPGIWAILAMAYWEIKYKTTKRYRIALTTEEELFLEEVYQILEEQLTSEITSGLIKAANILDFTQTQAIGIGNADAYGYERDCVVYWQAFEPYAAHFLDALSISETWVHRWVIIAQVLWSHFRWVSDTDYYSQFSVEAAHFFLKKALELPLNTPIHYYDFWEVAPDTTYSSGYYKETQGKLAVLQSNFGVLYFYYAQLLHHHFKEYTLAREYYKKFIAAEPTLLPDNNYELFWVAKEKRIYPPCIQAAYTALGRTYEATSAPSTARNYYYKAISLRPENHQAPYELLAALYAQDGKSKKAFEFYQKKLNVCMHTSFKNFQYSYGKSPVAYFYYDPEKRKQAAPVNGTGYYKYGAVEVVWLIDLAKKVADMAFWELEELRLAQQYYKTCNYFLQSNSRIRQHKKTKEELKVFQLDIWEQQALVAYELKDYWQARSLYKKILKTKPDHASVGRALQQIKAQLGY